MGSDNRQRQQHRCREILIEYFFQKFCHLRYWNYADEVHIVEKFEKRFASRNRVVQRLKFTVPLSKG